MATPTWVRDYVSKQFSSGPVMGQDGERWCRQARTWMRNFVATVGGTDFTFRVSHYSWSCFFKRGNQWWYCSSGDVRVKICDWLLIRTCSGPKDFTGGVNRSVKYDERFEESLRKIVTGNGGTFDAL